MTPRGRQPRSGTLRGGAPRGAAGLVPAVLLVLAGCAGATDDARNDAAAARASDPGYSATDARIVETGPDGQPRYALRAATIRQDPRSLEVSLERLSMQVRDAGESPWTVTAAAGLMPQDASRIDLRGSVRVAGTLGGESGGRPGVAERGAGGGATGAARSEPIEIRSDALRYEFASGLVTSDAEVTVRLTGKWLEARGLQANLKQRQVRLESNVHGRFVP